MLGTGERSFVLMVAGEQAELGRQSPLERHTRVSKYIEELYPETIELKRKDIELLSDSLRHIRRELDKFTRPS